MIKAKHKQCEEAWIKAAVKGDTVAFEQLMIIYEKKIYN